MKPILKNILFKPFPSDNVKNGIIVPESFKEINNKGTVVEIGNKVTKLKKGDIGFRVKDWGTEIIIGGEKHYLMDESAILALQ